jgi:hypothetical protein
MEHVRCEIAGERQRDAVRGAALRTGAGILCVRFYDIGKIPDPNPDAVRLTFEIVVSHP